MPAKKKPKGFKVGKKYSKAKQLALPKSVPSDTALAAPVEKIPLSFFMVEAVLVILLVYQVVFNILGFRFRVSEKIYGFALTDNLIEYVFLGLIILAFAVVYFSLKRKHPQFFQEQKQMPSFLKQAAKEKMRGAKEDSRVMALAIFQLIFIFVIVISIAAYLDPEYEIIEWSKLNVYPPLTTVLNTAIFALVLVIIAFLYSYTKHFRLQNSYK